MFQRLGFADMQVIPSEMALGVGLVELEPRMPCLVFRFALSGMRMVLSLGEAVISRESCCLWCWCQRLGNDLQ